MPTELISKEKAARLAPCPPALNAILEALGTVKGIELANLSYLLKESPETIRRDVVDYLDRLPGEFVRHILVREFTPAGDTQALRRAAEKVGPPIREMTDEDLAEFFPVARSLHLHAWRMLLIEYEFLRRSAIVLAELGELAKQCIETKTAALTVSLLPTRISIDENGIADVMHSRLAVALDGANLSRIRQCEICGAIFWAGRIDKAFCSDSCGNKLRKSRSAKYAQDRKVKEYAKEQRQRSKNKKAGRDAERTAKRP